MRYSRRTLLAVPLAAPGLSRAAGPLVLPKPRTGGGKPLFEVLAARRSAREFSPEKLSRQILSDLLWAAWGINRPDGRRTAPSASNRQEIDVYVAMEEGLYRYEAGAHRLEMTAAEDVRAATGEQGFVAEAPVNLVYVADFSRMGGTAESRAFYSAANTGFIAQNVYLFCGSEGLATVVRGLVDRPALAKSMRLREGQRITLAQTVGYPRQS